MKLDNSIYQIDPPNRFVTSDHECLRVIKFVSPAGSDTYEKIDIEKFSPPGDEAK